MPALAAHAFSHQGAVPAAIDRPYHDSAIFSPVTHAYAGADFGETDTSANLSTIAATNRQPVPVDPPNSGTHPDMR